MAIKRRYWRAIVKRSAEIVLASYLSLIAACAVLMAINVAKLPDRPACGQPGADSVRCARGHRL